MVQQARRWHAKSMLLGALIVGAAWMAWTAMTSGDSSSQAPNSSTSTNSAAVEEKPIEDPLAYLNEKAALMTQKAQARRIAATLEFASEERQIIDKALERKIEARAAVMQQLMHLHRLLQATTTTDRQLEEAIATLLEKKGDLLRELERIDQQLSTAVSVRVRARLLTTGILDNGLGMMAGPREAKPQVPMQSTMKATD